MDANNQGKFENLTEGQNAAILSMQSTRGQLLVWPNVTSWNDILDLERRGIIYHVFHGPSTYGAITYHLNS